MGRKFAAVVFSLGCLQASTALALGLGEFKLESYLNEPLQGSVDLLNMGSLHQDEIKIRLGTREDFERLGLDRPFFLTSIEFDVVVDDDGRGRILMSTDDPVLEPYLDFIVEARWPTGRLLREYTVLIDPPTFADDASVVEVSASERVEEVEGIPAPAKKKEQAAASDGTRVDVRKSDLAPGEMPERGFSADASSSPGPGSRYMVRRDETLWSIASRARPEGASVHQTMLDIQRLNPDAFINNNINRVKAGYIIYLPSADDISSGNLAAALEEVREQNEAWRAGRDEELAAASGPSLRISADPQVQDGADGAVEESGVGDGEDATATPGVSRTAEAAETTGDEGIDTAGGEQIAAMERRLQTLERIVDLKDEQIAALQAALAEAQDATAGDDAVAPDEAMADAGDAGEVAPSDDDQALAGAPGEAAPAETVTGAPPPEDTGPGETPSAPGDESAPQEDAARIAGEPTTEPTTEPAPAETPASTAGDAPEEGRGISNALIYAAAALVLALLGFFVWRRRSGDSETVGEDTAADRDPVVSDVPLREEERPVEKQPPIGTTPQPEPEPDLEVPATTEGRDNRGYGERRHDAYASDVDASDALAEADIYIAYGRHPQAIELLRGALQNEPENPVYRLKLLEIHVELNDRDAAISEFEHIRRSGDKDSIARGEQLLTGLEAADQDTAPAGAGPMETTGAADDGPGLPPNPLDLMDEGNESLEGEFDDLEIEQGGAADEDEVPEELDLSADFEGADAGDDEELVIAADSNGLSTKLDLARAYLDMGDDEGARQILEEIIAEGSDELRIEAQALLDRIE
ncbi:MAG: FimV/HubP family polar landmark protein [Halioglobus sp.]|nr:FimV/HubP family polar landmark protein [Halioglobus sp.]